MKYIDADKLIAEINWYKGINIKIVCEANKEYCRGYTDAIEDILHTITSLQQEPRFPQYDNIVEKIFGAGNLEGWEFREAEMLVALAKEELLKSLQQEQLVNKDLGTLIACDIIEMTVKKAIDKPQDKEKDEELMTRKINYLRSLEENCVQQEQQKQPEVDLEEDINDFIGEEYRHYIEYDGYNIAEKDWRDSIQRAARHFYELARQKYEK